MAKPDFQEALNQAAKELDQGLPDAAERRIRARLNGEPARGRTVRWGRVGGLGFAAAVAATLVVVALKGGEPGTEYLGGFALVSPSTDFKAQASADAQVQVAQGRCTLKDEALGAMLAVAGGTRLRRAADGVEVAEGSVEVDVDHGVVRSAPYQVRVSHGVIEVLGTRFTVTQRPNGGEVTLHRGSIRFRSADGRVEVLSVGQTLAWPLPAVVVAPVQMPPDPAPPPVKPSALTVRAPVPAPASKLEPAPPAPLVQKVFDPEELLNRIAVLRSRGQFEDAVAALRSELEQAHPAPTRERLSYELGAILTLQMGDKVRACAHWRQHQGQFPGGRYDREVAQARGKLECSESP